MGENGLPLLLLPGTLCDARLFAELTVRLAGVQSHVVEFHGAASMRDAARLVLSEAPERFALLGFSLGGMVALEVMRLAPERVCGLALLSTSPLPVPAERHAARRAAVQEAATMPIGTFLRTRMAEEYGASAEDMERMAAMAESQGHAVFKRQTEMALTRPDYRPMLPSIDCPTLVVAGVDDRLCPADAQRAFAAGLPNATLCMVPSAGHLCLLERPDEVASAVAAWLHTVCAFQAATAQQENG